TASPSSMSLAQGLAHQSLHAFVTSISLTQASTSLSLGLQERSTTQSTNSSGYSDFSHCDMHLSWSSPSHSCARSQNFVHGSSSPQAPTASRETSRPARNHHFIPLVLFMSSPRIRGSRARRHPPPRESADRRAAS